MCLPAAVVGVITAVTSVVGSIAAYSQQQQETSYRNSVAQAQYQNQLIAYDRSVQATQEQYRLNAEAANRGYISEQNKLRAEYQRAAMDQQQLLVSSLQTQGTVLASGRAGQSVGLLASDAERQYGRDLATLGLNLAYSQQDFFTATEGIYNQAQNANTAAAMNQTLEPMRPPMEQGPSALGLMTGIAGGVLGGYNAYQSLRAPSAGGGGPSGGTWSSGGLGSSQFQPGRASIYTPSFSPVPGASYFR
jgi:hypothetical protein